MFSTEEKFKNILDWKFINYLVNKITKYEDMGYYVLITVHTSDSFMQGFRDIYTYTNDTTLHNIGYYKTYSEQDVNWTYKTYLESGIFYYIDIYDEDRVTNEELCREYGNDISKYGKYFENGDDDGIYIKKEK